MSLLAAEDVEQGGCHGLIRAPVDSENGDTHCFQVDRVETVSVPVLGAMRIGFRACKSAVVKPDSSVR